MYSVTANGDPTYLTIVMNFLPVGRGPGGGDVKGGYA